MAFPEKESVKNEVSRRDSAPDSSTLAPGTLDRAVDAVTASVGTALAAGASLLVGSQVALRAGVWMQPRPMPHRQAALLEHPWRLRYRDPATLLGQIGVLAGMRVADLGCGTGLFTAEMARRVGDAGQVHAVDMQAEMLALARQRVERAGVGKRVRFYHSGLHALPLPDASVDVALLAAVLGEVPARLLALDEIRRVLKPGARLAISEELPDPAYVPAPLVRRWAEVAGFRFGALTGTPFCYTMLFFVE
jgi:SAM-dependent methyltransferase